MRVRFLLLALLPAAVSAPACAEDDPARAVTLGTDHEGPGVRIALEPFEIVVRDRSGRTVLASLPEGGNGPYGAPAAATDEPSTVARALEGWDGYQENVARWSRATLAREAPRDDGARELRLAADGGELVVVVTLDGPRVILDLEARPGAGASAGWNKTSMAFRLGERDHFLGLGQRGATFDHRGHSLYSWAEEAGLGRGEREPAGPSNPTPNGVSMTHFPIPFFHASAGFAAHIDTPLRSEVHFGSERPDAFRFAVNGRRLRLVVYVGSPLENLERFTEDTGRAPVPAPWAFGPRRRVNVFAKIGDAFEHELMRQKKIAVTTIDDAQHFLPAGDNLDASTLRSWTSTLHAWGYKAVAYNTPYVSASEGTAALDFAKGSADGLFLRDETGAPALVSLVSGKLQKVAAIDFTHPGAEPWFHSLLERTLDAGYDGTMLDFGEYVRRDFRASDGRSGADIHNLYPVWSAKAAQSFFEARRPGDHTFFVRSGYAGTAALVPEVWGGDPEATFDETQGLPAALRGSLALALSGVPYVSTDVGGFKCYTDAPRDKEVYLRWVQAGALLPMMHDEDACANVLEPKTKWKLWNDEETIDVYAKMARLHTRLTPYFLVLAREAHDRGVPPLRPLMLVSPDAPRAYAIDDAFFLGPALFAAPVVRRGQLEKRTWLPPGLYVDLDDKRVYEGDRDVVIPAPLGKAPLLLARGHLLPLLDETVDTLAPASQPGVVSAAAVADRLDVIVALGPGERASLVLADGTELEAVRDAAGREDPLASVTAAELATCSRCFVEAREGDVDRLRIVSETAPDTTLVKGGVRLRARGRAALRVRWDVLRL